jgi:putative peptidoglycan lipid II flippase
MVSCVSFVNQLLIAKSFGSGLHLDAYLAASGVPLLLMGILSGLLLHSVLPVQMRYVDDAEYHRHLSGALLTIFTVLSAAQGVLLYVVSPTLIVAVAPNLPPEVMGEAIAVSRLSAVTLAVNSVATYLACLHNLTRSFYVPVVAGLLPYLAMCGALIAFGTTVGVVALAWGLLLGTACQLGALVIGIRRMLSIPRQWLRVRNDVLDIFASMPAVLVAMLAYSAYNVIDPVWATRLGPGALSYLGYGQRLLNAFGNLMTLGAGTVLLPMLSTAAVEGRQQDLVRHTCKAVRVLFAVGAPASLTLAILATPILRLLLERGAFGRTTTMGVASVLPWMLLAMMALQAGFLVFKALFAVRALRSLFLLGAVATLSYFVSAGALGLQFGVVGMAAAYALSWWITLALAAYQLSRLGVFGSSLRRLPGLQFTLQLLVSLAAMAVTLTAAKRMIIDTGDYEQSPILLAVKLCATMALGGIAYLVLAVGVCKMEEVLVLLRLMRGFVPGPLGATVSRVRGFVPTEVCAS